MKLGQNILSLMLMLCLSALSAASIQRWDASVTEIDLNVFSGLDDDALCSDVWNMSGEPYLYGGKERMRDNGLNEYDFSARRLNSALCLWTTPDPLAEQFANTNPLAYCAANPIKFIDPDGCDIFILNYEYLLDQHMAMLIQNDKGKWQYYSINGDKMYNLTSHSSGRPFNDVAVGSWESPQEFLDSSYNVETDAGAKDKSINNYGFTEGYQIHTTPQQDEIMRNSFVEKANTEYNFITNNCATVVQDVLKSAGIPTTEPSNVVSSNLTSLGLIETPVEAMVNTLPLFTPSMVFKSLMELNPDGIYIRK